MSRSACLVLLVLLSALASAHLSRLPGPFSNTHLRGLVDDPLVCETVFTLGGSKFNVSSLVLDVGGYVAQNLVPSSNTSYCLNICKAVTSERNCICYPCDNRTYPAAQVIDTANGQQCAAYLGQLDAASWTLLNPSKPSAGLVLTYGQGENGRSTRVNLHCNPKAQPYTTPAFVGQQGSVFVFEWITTAACPVSSV